MKTYARIHISNLDIEVCAYMYICLYVCLYVKDGGLSEGVAAATYVNIIMSIYILYVYMYICLYVCLYV